MCGTPQFAPSRPPQICLPLRYPYGHKNRLESLAFGPNLSVSGPAIQLPSAAAHNAGTAAFIKCQQMMPPFNFADGGAVMGSEVRVVS